jgi:hypothetical protein
MKKIICICIVWLAIAQAHAQCAFEDYHKIGSDQSTEVKLLEAADGKSIYVLWSATIDSASTTTVRDREIWIARYDDCGNRLWIKHYGFAENTTDLVKDAIITPEGYLLIAGYGEDMEGGGIYNGTVFKLTANGDVVWKQFYGGRNGLVLHNISYNAYHNTYLLSGTILRLRPTGLWDRAYIFEIDTAGKLLREKDIFLNNDSIQAQRDNLKADIAEALPDGSILAVITSNQADSIYLIKLTPNLEITWIKKPFAKKFEPIGLAKVEFNNKTQQYTAICGGYRFSDGLQASWILNIDTIGNITQSHILDNPSETGSGFRLTKDGGYLFGYTALLKYDSLFQVKLFKQLSIQEPIYHVLLDVIQLKSGAFAGVGISRFHSNNQYNELLIMQSHPNGAFVTNPEIEQKAIGYSIYPNPSAGVFTLPELEEMENTMVLVYDVYGKLVHKATIESNELDLTDKADGLYYIRIESKTGVLITSQSVFIKH